MRGDVDRRNDGFRKHASQRLTHRQGLGRADGRDAREDSCLRLGHAEQTGVQFVLTAGLFLNFMFLHFWHPVS
jgi:hypothetical protein